MHVVRYDTDLNMIGFRDGIPEDWETEVGETLRRNAAVLVETPYRSRDAFFAQVFVPKRRALAGRASVPVNRDDLPAVEYSFRGFEHVGDTSRAGYPIEKIADPYTPERLAQYRLHTQLRPQTHASR